jgi:hypothetical protein
MRTPYCLCVPRNKFLKQCEMASGIRAKPEESAVSRERLGKFISAAINMLDTVFCMRSVSYQTLTRM